MNKEEIENLTGESLEDMGLEEHFESTLYCTECGDELPENHRYGDCTPCLDRRFGIGNY